MVEKKDRHSKFKIKMFDIDLEEVEIYEESKNSLKIVFYDKKINDFNFNSIKDFFKLYLKHNEDFKDFLLKEYEGQTLKEKLADFILDFKTVKKNYKFIRYSLDLTAEKSYIKLKDNTLILTYNKLSIPENLEELDKILNTIKIKELNVKEYKHYIKTFRNKHFKEINDILKFINIFLFYTDKKQSFMNIISPSNFGKTDFLIDILSKRLNIGVKLEQKNLEYTPSPFSANDFIRKGTALIDEFTIFRKEFKTMTNELILNPKGEKQVEVELFSKLFFSKERSKSFTGVVDSQIINRVLIIDKSKSKTIPDFLSENKDIDPEKLKDYLTIYYYRYITKGINYYKKLDFTIRQKTLQKQVEELRSKYKLKNIQTTEEYIKKVFYTDISNILENLKNQDNNEIIIGYDYNEFAFKLENNVLYINKFETYLTYILKRENEQYFNNVKFSLSNNDILDIVEVNKSKRIKGKTYTTTAIKINEEEIKKYNENIILNSKDKEIQQLKKELEEIKHSTEKEKRLINNLFSIITKNSKYQNITTIEELENILINSCLNQSFEEELENRNTQAETEEKIDENCPF